MRLIDADKLKSLFSPALTGKTTHTADEIMLSIVSSPTVEAIPFEWVGKWLENNSRTLINPDYYEWRFTEEPIDYYVTIYPHEVKRMLNDWEKENEGKKNEL